jgi:hypothetical protein
MKTLALAGAMLFAFGFMLFDTPDIPWTPMPDAAAACCKVCSAGKACGDSCISRSKRCHKGGGCACDG